MDQPGFGTASETGAGATGGACAVVNAFGDVVDPATGEWVAGARAEGSDAPADTEALFRGGFRREPFAPENTTLAVVATADLLAREELLGVARMAHAALCRAIRPVHTPMDGDIVVALIGGDEATLKRYYRESETTARLQPANASMPPIHGRRTSGTTMEPSACWHCSNNAT